MNRPKYEPPEILEQREDLPSYMRAYSNTCPFLAESCARSFFEKSRPERKEECNAQMDTRICADRSSDL